MNQVKEKKQRNSGITLIALVITVIVMLILAGITINLTIGQEGILKTAEEAGKNYANAANYENAQLRELNNTIDNILVSNYRGDKNYDINIYDVWTTWLSLAGIQSPETYSGKNILSNESLMETVMNDAEAMDYLVNSKVFILPAVLNSEIASTKLYKSTKLITIPKLEANNDNIIIEGFREGYSDQWGKYEKYYPFDDDANTWTGSKLSEEASIGSFIGYDFEKPVNIFKVEGKIRMLSYKIQYSDDKENWIDCVENTSPGSDSGNEFSDLILKNTGKHRYWRLYVNGGQTGSDWGALVYSLQFYGV